MKLTVRKGKLPPKMVERGEEMRTGKDLYGAIPRFGPPNTWLPPQLVNAKSEQVRQGERLSAN